MSGLEVFSGDDVAEYVVELVVDLASQQVSCYLGHEFTHLGLVEARHRRFVLQRLFFFFCYVDEGSMHRSEAPRLQHFKVLLKGWHDGVFVDFRVEVDLTK